MIGGSGPISDSDGATILDQISTIIKESDIESNNDKS